jgi:hypothetical protein
MRLLVSPSAHYRAVQPYGLTLRFLQSLLLAHASDSPPLVLLPAEAPFSSQGATAVFSGPQVQYFLVTEFLVRCFG